MSHISMSADAKAFKSLECAELSLNLDFRGLIFYFLIMCARP